MAVAASLAASSDQICDLRQVVSPPSRAHDDAMTAGANHGGEADYAALMKRIAEDGDREAFKQVYLHFAPRLRRYLMSLKTGGALADDLVQEVLLTVWRKAGQFDPNQAALATWIFTIARNRRIDAFRRENRPEIDPDDPMLVPDPEPAADQAIASEQQNRLLLEAVAALPREQAALLRMSYFEDLSHSEIAERLDLPLGTVKSRLRLAMAKLHSLTETLA